MPLISSVDPNVYRCSPPPMSMPTVAIAKPIKADTSPSSLLPCRITTRVRSPATVSRNSSGGPKLLASDAVTGAAMLIRIAPIVPATNDAIAAITRAGPARPLRARGYPSNVLATVADSPGVLISTDVMVPPYIAP